MKKNGVFDDHSETVSNFRLSPPKIDEISRKNTIKLSPIGLQK